MAYSHHHHHSQPQSEKVQMMEDHLHGGTDSSQDFLRKFYIVTILLGPLLLLSHTALEIFDIADFSLRPLLQFGIATVIFYIGRIFFQHAQHEIKGGQYGMMTLVSLAVGAGYLFSAASTFLSQLEAEFYLEISTLIWVLLFGHYLEARSSSAAGDALQEVAKLLPKEAHVLEDGEVIGRPVTELQTGDMVIVKPGEKVPADGVITEGEAHFNEALVSGESKPQEKHPGDRVVAGSICIDGSVQVRLDKVGENSTIGQIQKLISQAQSTKPKTQALADRAASILTFVAIGVAILTILVWTFLFGEPFVFALTLAITVLVIACPHALGLAIPTVSTIATSLAVKNGLFVKNIQKLETAKEVGYVVFDKTGTLTKGEFGVTDTVVLKGSEKDLLSIARSLESSSSHVIGLSIVTYAKEKKVTEQKVDGFKNSAGKGVTGKVAGKAHWIGNRILMEEQHVWTQEAEAAYQKLASQGKTVIFIADNKQVIGLLGLSDQIKQESYRSVEQLHELGVKVAMLTGDAEAVAKAVAKELNIDTYFAEVLPDQKYEKIKSLQDLGYIVMMVGDGVNDAPALTQANVGVAIGAGTDVAVEAGDIVLTRNSPLDVVRLVVLAKKVYRKMVENLIWALGYNVVAIPAAAGVFIPFGLQLSMQWGAVAMSLSSVIVVLNAFTLKRSKLTV